jgi:type VI secretion system secreted protein VgrG
MASIQAKGLIELSTTLGEDVLLFHSMSATEQLGGLFEYRLEMESTDEKVKFEDILGQSVTVRLTLHNDKERFFNGYVTRFSQVEAEPDKSRYSAVVRPWLWFLTRTSDCRIFQEMTVPEVIEKVFADHDYAAFENKLSGSYRKWVYCVQYRETDFNFVSRLMEQEGIYYYFKHDKDKHTLILADAYSSHEAIPGYEEVPYFPPTANVVRDSDFFTSWSASQEVQPGAYTLTDFDFEKPKADLAVKSTASRKHDKAKLEIYDFPGEYLESGDGEQYVKTRLEEFQAQHELVNGAGNVRGLYSGGLFKLTKYPRDDRNREYLVVSASHRLQGMAYASSAESAADQYTGSIVAMDSKQPYRPMRHTAKPTIQGPQTAMVVGKAGEEIWTDKYGRVKIQFHWDREGKEDENSSCWVRVAQVWAGKTWGGMQIPRIGQEVIVEFLEGDPDRPIITGRVYNADAMPPYALPDNQTQSGIKTRSTKGGTGENFNEIRFEDKKGEEELYIHAEKNHTNITENDRNEDVGANRSLKVGGNLKEEIKGNKESTVDTDHTEHIKGHDKVTVDSGQELTVTAGGRKVKITGDHERTVNGNEKVTINGPRQLSVAGTERFEWKADSFKLVYGIAQDHFLGMKMSTTQGINAEEYLAFKYSIGAAGVLAKTADKNALKTSKSEIDATTHIKMKAPHVEIEGTSTIALTGGDIFIDGDSIKLKAGGTTVEIASSGVSINGKLIEK